MQAQTEACRTAARLLDTASDIPAPKQMRELLEQMRVELNRIDTHVNSLETAELRVMPLADAIIPDLLPEPYLALGLAPYANRLIEVLYKANGKGVTREAIYYLIYDKHPDEKSKAAEPYKLLDVYACRIRKAMTKHREMLQANNLPSYLNTVWSKGYALCHEPVLKEAR